MPQIDAHDPRWNAFIESHPRSSVFHSSAWLKTLERTYGFRAAIVTSAPPGVPIRAGVPVCSIKSWLTGFRVVSLPFSDHCEVLADSPEEQGRLFDLMKSISERPRYFEVRPRTRVEGPPGWTPAGRFVLHSIDLKPELQHIYASLHKDSIQRKIRRAERDGIRIEQGQSRELLDEFYRLFVRTRRRHGAPPQPVTWFENLIAGFGDRLQIRLARMGNQPIASILTLRHKRSLVYKYGCSDERFHNAGGIPFLFWHAIQEAKSLGLEELDLGRTDLTNEGLVRFKDHLGGVRNDLTYWRFYPKQPTAVTNPPILNSPRVQRLLTRLPDPLFRLAGRLLYRHVG